MLDLVPETREDAIRAATTAAHTPVVPLDPHGHRWCMSDSSSEASLIAG